MNREIKEILDNPKILMLSYGNYISLDDYFKLKDYITNLQERIDKALDKITTEQLYTNYSWGKTYYAQLMKDLRNILEGKDNDKD